MRLLCTLFLAAIVLASAGCSDTSTRDRSETVFDVSNKTATPIARVAIRTAATDVEHYAAPLECAPGQEDCRILYVGDRLDGPVDFTFSDARGVMVAAYRLAKSSEAYESIEVSARTTGAYLIDRLFRISPELTAMDQAQREARARQFARNYDSPDGVTDYHEEMAAHYAHRVAKDGSSVPRFLEVLAGRLLAFDTAGAEEFLPPAVASAPTRAATPSERAVDAADGSCSTAYGNLLAVSGSAAFGVQGAFPIAGTIMSAVVGLLSSACDDTSSRLDAIDSRLNELQVSLDALADRLGELRSFTAKASINTGEDAFQSLTQNVDRMASTFRALKQNYRVGSLREYVQVVGAGSPTPLRAALAREDGSGPLSDLLRNFRPAGLGPGDTISPLGGPALQQFEALLRDGAISTMVEAVRLQCDDPPLGEIIKLRVNCNLFLGTSVARLAAAHRVASELAAEVYNLLDAYKVSDRDTVAQYSYLLARSSADHRAALSAVFRAQQDKLLTAYRQGIVGNPDPAQTGMYNAQRGLEDVLSSLGAASCYDGRLQIVAVTGWVRNASNEYLETQCRDLGVPVPARYHLVINRAAVNSRTDVCNVLGVPMPCSRLAAAGELRNYRVSTADRASEPLAVALTGGPPIARHFAIHASYPYSPGTRVLSTRGLSTTGKGLRLLNLPSASGDVGFSDLASTVPMQHFGIPDGQIVSVSWVRYTRPDGTSIVFALTGWVVVSLGHGILPSYVESAVTTLTCVTADCSPGEGIPRISLLGPYGLNFIDGPTGLTISNYGWKVSSADFVGTRDLHGFLVKQGDAFVPIYPR